MFTLSVKLIDREKIGSHVKIGALDLSDILNIENLRVLYSEFPSLVIGYIVPLDYALKDYNFLYYTISNLQVFCFPLSVGFGAGCADGGKSNFSFLVKVVL